MPNYLLDHVHVTSPDPLATAAFYEKMFNAKKVRVHELKNGHIHVTLDINGDGTGILVMTPREEQKLITNPSEVEYGLERLLGIRTDDIEATMAHLKANGVQIKEDIRRSSQGNKIAFAWAPQNVVIELLEKK